MLPQLQDLVRVYTPTKGAAPLVLGAAVAGFLPPEPMVDGGRYRYVLHDFDASGQPVGVELGLGTWNGLTERLVRTVNRSSTGALLLLSGRATVSLTVSAADLLTLQAAASAAAARGSNLSDLTDPAAARAALGLGSAATLDAEALPVSTATGQALAQALAALHRTYSASVKVTAVADGTVIDLGIPVDPAKEDVEIEFHGKLQWPERDYTLNTAGPTAVLAFTGEGFLAGEDIYARKGAIAGTA